MFRLWRTMANCVIKPKGKRRKRVAMAIGKGARMQYRLEQKFLCDARDYAVLKARIENVMQLDENAGENPVYHIRSVYFDDIYQSKFYENEDGVDNRNKYRIRAYNASDAVIHFERKSKTNGYNNKAHFSLTRERYEAFMAEDFAFVPSESPLENEISLQRLTRGLAPSVIIAYDREAYTCAAGNVRVTFDSNISASSEMQDFFAPHLPSVPILPSGQFILEVKFDEFLPRHIERALDIRKLQRTTFSKFYLGKQALASFEGGYFTHPLPSVPATTAL